MIEQHMGRLAVSLQEIGDATAMLGRIIALDGRADGYNWAMIHQLLARAAARIAATSAEVVGAEAEMGSKINPDKYDCYYEALPDEPIFTLVGRDLNAPDSLRCWAQLREQDIAAGRAPKSDHDKVLNARALAAKMESWRESRFGAWRPTDPSTLPEPALAAEGQ